MLEFFKVSTSNQGQVSGQNKKGSQNNYLLTLVATSGEDGIRTHDLLTASHIILNFIFSATKFYSIYLHIF